MPLRLAAPLVVVMLAAAPLAGCGDSSIEIDEIRTGTITSEVQIPEPDQAPVGAGAKSCDAYASDVESLRATGVPCDQARQVMYGWRREASCPLPGDASRGACQIRSYRCQSTRTDRGLAVSCARAGQSIAFLAKP